MEKSEKNQYLEEKELMKILNPNEAEDEDAVQIKKMLFIKYPRNLAKKEQEKCKEEKMRMDLEEKFQKMYGLEEADM